MASATEAIVKRVREIERELLLTNPTVTGILTLPPSSWYFPTITKGM